MSVWVVDAQACRFSDAGDRDTESEPQPEPAGVRKPPENEGTLLPIRQQRALNPTGRVRVVPFLTLAV